MTTTKTKLHLNIELTNGNDGRGSKWFSTAKVRKTIEAYLRAHGHTSEAPKRHPVRLRITRILGPRQSLWDADSILRGNAKELIDAFVACGWFVDDSPKYVSEVIGLQDKTDRANGPAIIFEIEEITAED